MLNFVAINQIIGCLKMLVEIRKDERVHKAKFNIFKEAISIYNTKIKPKKPIFTVRKRSKTFGSGPFDLRNHYQRQSQNLLQIQSQKSKQTLYTSATSPIIPISPPPALTTSSISSSDSSISNLSDLSLPTHISEISQVPKIDVKAIIDYEVSQTPKIAFV